MGLLLNTIFKSLFILLVFYGLYILALSFFNKKYEGFLNFSKNNLSPGDFPLTVDKPLLADDYILKKTPQLSTLNASDIYTDYPIFPSHSTKLNNIRYWSKPENGTCSRAELCGDLYEDYTDQHIPPPLTNPGWNKRVNFYEEDY